MIFHTVCDPVYFDFFYKDFYKSFGEYCQNATFSLNYVGIADPKTIDFCNLNKIYFQNEITTLDDLRCRFQDLDDGNILGYYPLARWKSIPLNLDNVCVCDVDILAIEKVDICSVDKLLESNDVVNITRKKPDGANGGMMLMCLSKTILSDVKKFAENLSNTVTSLSIAEDIKVRKYIYENFKVYELHGKMLDLTKPKYVSNGEWFVYSKGGQGNSSIKKLQKLQNNLKLLREQK